MQFTPIGVLHCREKHPYDAARQAELAGANPGRIELCAGQHYEQAVQDLDGFERIWLLFAFDRNPHWKPLVLPPRRPRKVGVFASRAPYRPNPIGLSCVRLVAVRGRWVDVAGHDLLDGTPILDIKPYIPYADSFPEAATGWLDELETGAWTLQVSEAACAQLDWLAQRGVDRLAGFLQRQLAERPFDRKRKRVRRLDADTWELAYRTWRARFSARADSSTIRVESVCSGYTPEERRAAVDPYGDKAVHRDFVTRFGNGAP